jgi:hypothetical protein
MLVYKLETSGKINEKIVDCHGSLEDRLEEDLLFTFQFLSREFSEK